MPSGRRREEEREAEAHSLYGLVCILKNSFVEYGDDSNTPVIEGFDKSPLSLFYVWYLILSLSSTALSISYSIPYT